jgi:hypothetical protein
MPLIFDLGGIKMLSVTQNYMYYVIYALDFALLLVGPALRLHGSAGIFLMLVASAVSHALGRIQRSKPTHQGKLYRSKFYCKIAGGIHKLIIF